MEVETETDKVREQTRLRVAKFYETNKAAINEKKRIAYLKKKNPQVVIQPEVAVAAAPPPPPVPNKTKNDILLEQLKSMDLNANTKLKYIADFKRVLAMLNNEDIVANMKKGKELVKKISETEFSTNTKRGLVQICLFMITNFKLVINQKSLKEMKIYFDTLKVVANEENDVKVENEIIPTWMCLLESLKIKFGANSKIYVLASLYKELTLRDDFILKIVSKLPKDETNNYIVLGKTNHTIVINNYKTRLKHGVIKQRLSKKMSQLLSSYITENKLNENDYLFGDSKQSPFIKASLAKVGIEGSSNLFRHMSITEELAKTKTPEERVRLADKMKHSVQVQSKYMRKNEKPVVAPGSS